MAQVGGIVLAPGRTDSLYLRRTPFIAQKEDPLSRMVCGIPKAAGCGIPELKGACDGVSGANRFRSIFIETNLIFPALQN